MEKYWFTFSLLCLISGAFAWVLALVRATKRMEEAELDRDIAQRETHDAMDDLAQERRSYQELLGKFDTLVDIVLDRKELKDDFCACKDELCGLCGKREYEDGAACFACRWYTPAKAESDYGAPQEAVDSLEDDEDFDEDDYGM